MQKPTAESLNVYARLAAQLEAIVVAWPEFLACRERQANEHPVFDLLFLSPTAKLLAVSVILPNTRPNWLHVCVFNVIRHPDRWKILVEHAARLKIGHYSFSAADGSISYFSAHLLERPGVVPPTILGVLLVEVLEAANSLTAAPENLAGAKLRPCKRPELN